MLYEQHFILSLQQLYEIDIIIPTNVYTEIQELWIPSSNLLSENMAEVEFQCGFSNYTIQVPSLFLDAISAYKLEVTAFVA